MTMTIPTSMAEAALLADERMVPTGDEKLDQMLHHMWLETAMVAMTNREILERDAPVYWTTQHLVLERGHAFRPQVLPQQWKRGTPQQCFRNSFSLAMESNLLYCEGYAWKGLLVAHHAWCADADDNVIDVTWDEPEAAVYWGIRIPWEEMFRRLAARKNMLPILDDWEQGYRWMQKGWDLDG